MKRMNKTELLLPVGNVEAFYAAVEAGADAVYLGIKKFNARGRAGNFTYQQLVSIMEIARKNKIEVFITLNTVIKNEELPELFATLNTLNTLGVNAIIFQDWGVYYLARKYFPRLVMHSSTQLGVHNSVGVQHCESKHVKRAVLARELTLPEVKQIRKQTKAQLEVFVHGALCYSFSGMCLFSSYLGGKGANRGLCTQPCRRIFGDAQGDRLLFSLKDNEQIELVPELQKIGIDSIKIEGRMKAAEYVFRVGKAYRKALDAAENVKMAKHELQFDFARAKTPYFLGGSGKMAFTTTANTGRFIGYVVDVMGEDFIIKTSEKLEIGYRLRVVTDQGEQQNLKISAIEKTAKGYSISAHGKTVNHTDEVYLAGIPEKKFASKLPERKLPTLKHLTMRPFRFAEKALRRAELYLRIDSLGWLRKIRVEDYDRIIINLTTTEWKTFNFDAPFIQKSRPKFIFELPKFIPEGHLAEYKDLLQNTVNKGFSQFSLSHISQKEILPKGSRFICNENVYAFNDAAISFIQDEGSQAFSYPLESDFDNLAKSKNKSGILPLYFIPPVFVSRMPVKLEDGNFADDRNRKFIRDIRDGITYIYPDVPTSWLHYRERFEKLGLRRFLIDFSGSSPSKHLPKRVLQHYSNSEALQPATSFNMKLGMK
jgi:putative protease